MTDLVRKVTLGRNQNKNEFADFSTGDTVGVYVRVREGEKERIQLFKGVVLKIQGSGQGRSFTVRKMSGGIGVERTFPFTSPSLDRIEVIAYGKTRRSRLFYLRGLRGKAAKITSELALGNNKKGKGKGKAKAKADAADAPKE